MPFPSPPWLLRGRLWVSLLAVRGGAADRPAGVYAVGVVDYQGDTLAYRELFVARPFRDRLAPRLRITDIWVNSAASLQGGRALWAIPKQRAEVDLTQGAGTGPLPLVHAEATADRDLVAAATFATSPVAGPRVPIRFTVQQQDAERGAIRAGVVGSARLTPATGRWRPAPDGPLGWLSPHRPLGSVCLADFRLRFGG